MTIKEIRGRVVFQMNRLGYRVIEHARHKNLYDEFDLGKDSTETIYVGYMTKIVKQMRDNDVGSFYPSAIGGTRQTYVKLADEVLEVFDKLGFKLDSEHALETKQTIEDWFK